MAHYKTIYNYVKGFMDSKNGNFFNPNYYIDIELRPAKHQEVYYTNITPEYNGVLPIGDEFVRYHDKKVYDNGHYIHKDWAITDLPPLYMLTMFPKRQFKKHDITVTYTADNNYTYRKVYTPKVRDLTIEDKKLLRYKIDNEIYYKGTAIFNHLMWVDYIDYRFNIILNGKLLTNDIDYIILSPTLIMFLTNYKTDDQSSHAEVIIEYSDALDDILYNNFKVNSQLYKLYNQDKVIEYLFPLEGTNAKSNNFRDIIFRSKSKVTPTTELFKLPPLYDNRIYRSHMMLTKYFSTEAIVVGNATEYGKAWILDLLHEFPEFVTRTGKKKIDLTWDKIDKYDFTWDEIDDGALLRVKDKDVHEDIIVTTRLSDNLFNASVADRLSFTDKSIENLFKTQLNYLRISNYNRDLVNTFNDLWARDIVKIDEDGTPTEQIVTYKEPVYPRIVELPEKKPLNEIMINHAVFVGNFLDDLKHEVPYWSLKEMWHSNSEIVNKRIFQKSINDIFGNRKNMPPVWVDEDSMLCNGIPINFVVDPNKSVTHEDDPYYFRQETPEVLPEHKLLSNIPESDLSPDTLPEDRWIRIIPNLVYSKDIVTLYYNIRDKGTPVTLRMLLKAKGYILDDIDNYVFYIYYDDGTSYNIFSISLDENLKNVPTNAAIGSMYNKNPTVLLPSYKYNTLYINMGTSKYIANSRAETPIQLVFNFPKVTLDEYANVFPHLGSNTLSYDDIINQLAVKFNLDIKDLYRTKLPYEEKILLINPGDYTIWNEFKKDTVINIDLHKDKYVEYFNFLPKDVTVPAKKVRIYDIGQEKSSILTRSPEFHIPVDYTIKPKDYKFNTSELVETYVDPIHDIKSKTFIDYIFGSVNIQTDKIIEEDYTILSKKQELRKYVDYLYKKNRYKLVVNYKEEQTELDLQNDKYDISEKIIINDVLELMYNSDSFVLVDSTRTDVPVFTKRPPYMNPLKLANISINMIDDNRLYAFWTSDNNFNDNIDNSETTIVDTKVTPLPLDLSNYTSATFNYFLDEDGANYVDLYVYDKNNDEYVELIKDLSNKNIAEHYSVIGQLDYMEKYFFKYKEKYYRVIDLEALVLYSFYKYEKARKKNTAIDILVNQYDNGSYDLNTVYDRYNDPKNIYDMTPDYIMYWKEIYGYIDYVPVKTTYDSFITRPTIDLVLKHPGVYIKVKIEDRYGRSAYIMNRYEDNDEFYIEPDNQFSYTVTKKINYELLGNFIKSTKINRFSMEKAKITLYEDIYNNVDLSDTVKMDIDSTEYSTIYNVLQYAGSYTNTSKTLRRMNHIPLIELTYYLDQGHADELIETLPKEEFKRRFFTNSHLGFRAGIAANIPLKEYNQTFSNFEMQDDSNLDPNYGEIKQPEADPHHPVVVPGIKVTKDTYLPKGAVSLENEDNTITIALTWLPSDLINKRIIRPVDLIKPYKIRRDEYNSDENYKSALKQNKLDYMAYYEKVYRASLDYPALLSGIYTATEAHNGWVIDNTKLKPVYDKHNIIKLRIEATDKDGYKIISKEQLINAIYMHGHSIVSEDPLDMDEFINMVKISKIHYIDKGMLLNDQYILDVNNIVPMQPMLLEHVTDMRIKGEQLGLNIVLEYQFIPTYTNDFAHSYAEVENAFLNMPYMWPKDAIDLFKKYDKKYYLGDQTPIETPYIPHRPKSDYKLTKVTIPISIQLLDTKALITDYQTNWNKYLIYTNKDGKLVPKFKADIISEEEYYGIVKVARDRIERYIRPKIYTVNITGNLNKITNTIFVSGFHMREDILDQLRQQGVQCIDGNTDQALTIYKMDYIDDLVKDKENITSFTVWSNIYTAQKDDIKYNLDLSAKMFPDLLLTYNSHLDSINMVLEMPTHISKLNTVGTAIELEDKVWDYNFVKNN